MALHYAGEVKVKKLAVGPYDNNVYLVTCPETGEAVIVDGAAEPEKVLAAAAGAKVRYILQTHGHPDHTGALAGLREALGAAVGIHPDDAAMMKSPPDFLIRDGDRIPFGNRGVLAIH